MNIIKVTQGSNSRAFLRFKLKNDDLTQLDAFELVREGYNLRLRNVDAFSEPQVYFTLLRSQMKKERLSKEQIRNIIIAGGFTNYIKKLEAML